MWESLAPWLASGTVTGLILGVARLVYRLHYDVIAAERGRADDARARAEAEAKRAEAAERRADVREEQLGIVLGRKKDVAP